MKSKDLYNIVKLVSNENEIKNEKENIIKLFQLLHNNYSKEIQDYLVLMSSDKF